MDETLPLNQPPENPAPTPINPPIENTPPIVPAAPTSQPDASGVLQPPVSQPPTGQPGANPASPPSSLTPNVAAVLAYAFGFISGIIFYLISKDRFVRFHALQSIIFSVGISILYSLLTFMGYSFLGFLSFFIIWALHLATAVIWIILMVKAYNNEMYKLPVIGDFAESKA